MTDPIALDTDQARLLSLGIIIALLLLGFTISVMVTKIGIRLAILLMVVGLAALVYAQRSQIKESVSDCRVSFFGVELTPSDPDVRQACADQLNR